MDLKSQSRHRTSPIAIKAEGLGLCMFGVGQQHEANLRIARKREIGKIVQERASAVYPDPCLESMGRLRKMEMKMEVMSQARDKANLARTSRAQSQP